MDRQVELQDMLLARDRRDRIRKELIERHGGPVLTLCMNIPGPEKNNYLISTAFNEGVLRIEAALELGGIKAAERISGAYFTGNEAFWAIQGGNTSDLKRLCVGLEEEDSLGRLFDIDVWTSDNMPLSRESLGIRERGCLLCGREGKLCAASRAHPLPELYARVEGILEVFSREKEAKTIGSSAVRALLYEVCTSPKPGLVDRFGSGSHRDMDIFTFADSIAAIGGDFADFARISTETVGLNPSEAFERLRTAGARSEQRMYAATGLVNTHKGAIFTLGTVCAATARLWQKSGPCRDMDKILKSAAELADSYVRSAPKRGGATASASDGIDRSRLPAGARGELASGLEAVSRVGLPALRACLAQGASLEKSGATALLHIILHLDDTNMLKRGGHAKLESAREYVSGLISGGRIPSDSELIAADRFFTGNNLSPGGSADILSIVYYFYFLSASE